MKFECPSNMKFCLQFIEGGNKEVKNKGFFIKDLQEFKQNLYLYPVIKHV